MKRWLLTALFILLFAPSLYASDEVTSTTLSNQRFAAGWEKSYHRQTWINSLELSWKSPEKKSMFRLGVGGSKKWTVRQSSFEGDVGIDFIDTLSLQFGDAFEVEQESEIQLWVMHLGYDYYYPFKSGRWWKMDWEVYASVGVRGQFDLEISSSEYAVDITFREEEDGLQDTFKIPTGLTDKGFSFAIPACFNFDFAIATVRTCGVFHTKRLPAGSLVIAFGM
jgi:hypothetical protein